MIALSPAGAALLGTLLAVNLLLWAAAFALFHDTPLLLGTALLAYGFGLRHAVDADHIAAIDNVTRKLMSEAQRPAGVGAFFSAGHSSIVFGLSVAVALAAGAARGRFAALAAFGGLFGTLVSALFLFAIAAANLGVLAALARHARRKRAGGRYDGAALETLLARRGILARLFGVLFRLVRRSWHMYFVGLLFGLGFDTATEVALLGIAGAQAAHGLGVWPVMMFPALFAAGMALADTADSLLMLGAYGWAGRQAARQLGYNIAVTALSVLVAVATGGVELLGLLRERGTLSGAFWSGIATLNTHFAMIGYAIITLFAASWALAAAVARREGGRVK